MLTAPVLAEIVYVMEGVDFSRQQIATAVIDLIEQEPFEYDGRPEYEITQHMTDSQK